MHYILRTFTAGMVDDVEYDDFAELIADVRYEALNSPRTMFSARTSRATEDDNGLTADEQREFDAVCDGAAPVCDSCGHEAERFTNNAGVTSWVHGCPPPPTVAELREAVRRAGAAFTAAPTPLNAVTYRAVLHALLDALALRPRTTVATVAAGYQVAS